MIVRLTPFRRQGLALAALVWALDQGIKHWLTGPLDLAGREAIALLPVFALRYTQNFGVSLGMLTAGSASARLLLIGFTAAIALGVLVWLLRESARGEIAALALVLGGALGNITDRVTQGFVIDYADLHFGAWRPFLIFNLADAAITCGVLILLARALLLRDKPRPGGPAPAPETR